LSMPGSHKLATGKDHSTLFPCMDSSCGCQSAEECWKHCCCHSLSERLEWAKRNGIQPPRYVVVAVQKQGTSRDVECCGVAKLGKSCCNKRASATIQLEHLAGDEHASEGIVLLSALKCKGLGSNWLHAIPATPPKCFSWSFPLFSCSLAPAPFAMLPLVSAPPPVPPPRLGA
jgi:hypothetical protein